jgi:flagellar basal-body rod modification protein FlgD
MTSALVQKIVGAPVGAKSQVMSAQKVSNPTDIVKNEQTNTDFKSVLLNSNFQEKKKRESDAKGDLSGAKNYEDFLEKLNRQTAQKDAPKNNLDKNDFLKLFVTQLQAQDPLNPQDGTQMAAQLAQFNGLEQMLNVNTTLEKMMTAQNSGRAMQYVNYIGKELSISGGSVQLEAGKTNEVFVSNPMPLGRATLTVKDAFGKTVAERELGALDQGEHKIVWDGKDNTGKVLGNGKYVFDIAAQTSGGEPVDLKMTSKVQVTGVDLGEGGQNIYTTIGAVPFDSVKAVGSTGFTSAKVREAQAAVDLRKVKAQEERAKTVQGTAGQPSETESENLPIKEAPDASNGNNLDANGAGANNLSEATGGESGSLKESPKSTSAKPESSTVPVDQLPPEIRKSLEAQFGSKGKTNENKPGKIAVTNPPTPR